MTRILNALVAAVVVAIGASLAAQNSAPDIAFDSNADLLKTPDNVYVGEIGGVGQNSKGQIFVYTRTGHPYATLGDNRTFLRGGSRLFVFDKTGKFERELGQDVYGFNAAIGLRVDPQDNVWTIDVAASQVVKFDRKDAWRWCWDVNPRRSTSGLERPGVAAAAEPRAVVDEAQRKAVAPVPLQHRKPVAAKRAAAGAARPDRGCPVPPSTVQPTSRGIAPATSTLPTASPTPTALRNSTRTAGSSGNGVRPAPRTGNSWA
jgi:hypothetical protein